MTDRKKRGKASKIDLLPDPIRDQLNEMLRTKSISQKDIVAAINELVEAQGLGEDHKVSTSGLNRYSSKMETIGADMREARESAELWVSKFGSKPTGEVSMLLIEMLRTQSFKLLIKANDDPDEVLDPKTIGELALSIQRLEKSALLGMEREKAIRMAYAEETAAAVTEELRGEDGMSEQLENKIVDLLMGKA